MPTKVPFRSQVSCRRTIGSSARRSCIASTQPPARYIVQRNSSHTRSSSQRISIRGAADWTHPKPPRIESPAERCPAGRPVRRPAPADPLLGLGKNKAEVQKQGRRQKTGHHIAQINHLVEIIQLSGIMEGREDETRQAQQEKVQGPGSVAPPEIYKQSDREIDDADRVLIEDGRIAVRLTHDHIRRDLDPVVQNFIFGLPPSAQPCQNLRGFEGVVDVDPLDRNQGVAFVNSGFLRRTSRRDIRRDHRGRRSPARSTQVTPSSGRWYRPCCWKLIAAAIAAATVKTASRPLTSCCLSSFIGRLHTQTRSFFSTLLTNGRRAFLLIIQYLHLLAIATSTVFGRLTTRICRRRRRQRKARVTIVHVSQIASWRW